MRVDIIEYDFEARAAEREAAEREAGGG
jgi:hypothetical protein